MTIDLKQIKYFDVARKLSYKSDYHHKLGAVIVNKNKIVGLGFNKPNKTHTKSNHPFKTIHAKLDAMLGVSRENLKGATIYIYREHKNGSPLIAKPCKHCQELIRMAEIKYVCYTSNGTYIKEKL